MTRRRGRKPSRLRALAALLLFLTLLTSAYIAGRALEQRGAATGRGSLEGRFEDDRIIEYRDQRYRYRKQLTNILIMGIDTTAEGTQAGIGYRRGGQADFLLLLVIDHQRQLITPVHIDRDTMAEITVLGVLGNTAGTKTAQICLSHGFGDGQAQSCRFTVEAVSKLLLGVDVDFYAAMNLDSIALLNDALGGVTVTLEDDFSMLDPAMTAGTTLTLSGKQAEYYVRNRMEIGVGTNESRMARQRVYMDQLAGILGERIGQSASFTGELFDLLEPHLQTNMKRGRIINEAWRAHDYERAAIVTPAGEHITGSDGFVEFPADQAALEELVISLFFEPLS